MKVLKYSAEFASQVMSKVPSGYIDKTICGCGLTTVALENPNDTIIAVPTIFLATNKSEQYPNGRVNYRVLAVYGDTTREEINDYVFQCSRESLPLKFIVVYDSLYKVRHLLDMCDFIIDESNEILKVTKQAQRSQAVYDMLSLAEEYKDRVSFISATPIPLKYLPEWISEIDQIKIEWSGTTMSQPILAERTYPYKSLREEFLVPLRDNGEILVGDSKIKKVMVFLNSVSQILKTIKECKLDKKECGIICGDSLKNDANISGIKRYTSGSTPKYLFITSSGFAGIDIVDKEAIPIVVSHIGKSYTMVDMLTDLKQAVSRQRDKSNPHYGKYIYIYNKSVFALSEKELLKQIDDIRLKLERYITPTNEAVLAGERLMIDREFKDYTIRDDKGLFYINENVFNADRYFIMETRKQYKKGFQIQNVLGESTVLEPVVLPKEGSFSEMVDLFRKRKNKAKMNWGVYSTKSEWIDLIEDCYRAYGKVWKNPTYCKEMIRAKHSASDRLFAEIRARFKVGKKYTLMEAKTILGKIYKKHNLKRKPKHTDLSEVMEVTLKRTSKQRFVEILGRVSKN